jgi:FeS assembly SUF system protein
MTQENTNATPDESPETAELRGKVISALKTVYDPEIPVDIYELGLIYGVEISPQNNVEIKMTLTSPHCPVAETLPKEVEQRVAAVEGVASAFVEITWDPEWNPDMMSEVAKLDLNL